MNVIFFEKKFYFLKNFFENLENFFIFLMQFFFKKFTLKKKNLKTLFSNENLMQLYTQKSTSAKEFLIKCNVINH